MIKILDSTLREGSQVKGVKFSPEQKIRIAILLDDFGIDIIEAGHPIVSKEIRTTIKKIVNLKLRADILAHARAKIEDIKAVLDCGADWIGIWAGVNDLSLKYKYNRTDREMKKMVFDSIKYAKSNGLKVRYTIEDATRTNTARILTYANIAKESGADVLSLADTVGAATPKKYFDLIKSIRSNVRIKLEAHCHNDFGLALANALSAFEAGVSIIDATVNGLGERAGLVSLQELCVSLKLLYNVKNNWRLNQLQKVSKIVGNFSGVKLDNLRPIVGENSFTHSADLHIKATKKHIKCYESINPAILGRKRNY